MQDIFKLIYLYERIVSVYLKMVHQINSPFYVDRDKKLTCACRVGRINTLQVYGDVTPFRYVHRVLCH
jgi:hypothetical protein